MSYQEITNDRP